jgi:LysR family transcriptional regulator for metE and metH
VAEYKNKMSVVPVRLGRHGISKQIFLGVRASDVAIDYVSAFTQLAKSKRKPGRAAAARLNPARSRLGAP